MIHNPETSSLTTATCPLCTHGRASKLFSSRDRVHNLPGTFEIFRCGFCHAVFIQPSLSSQELARFYPQNYGRYRYSRSLPKTDYSRARRFVLQNYYGYPSTDGNAPSGLKKSAAFLLSFFIAKGVLPYRGEGKILDIGCGGGSYLYRLKHMGWNVYGVEASEIGVRHARSLGLDVRQGTLNEAQWPDAFFDVVRLSNVLEHLPEPKRTFQEIHRILQPRGLVYITVPNTRSVVFWLFGENWYGLDAPRHVISYCPKALEFLSSATGFEIADSSFTAGPFNFVRSVKYFLEEKGRSWPKWVRGIDWQRNKLIRRGLKPIFFFIDAFGFGDFLHATLRKANPQ